jgi:4-amino-4-deoxy-L-arabinose transferase-like glycosyltransferase
METGRRARAGPAAALLGLLLAAYAAAGIFMPGRHAAVFSGDIGVKYLQIDSLARGHAWLDFPAATLDAEGRLYPLHWPWVVEHEGRIFSVYLDPMIYLCSALYWAAGVQGSRMVPLLCVLGVVCATPLLARRLGLSPLASVAAAAIALVATPLWFYGWVLWEHAPATLACLAATVVAIDACERGERRRSLLAGGLLGLATAIRPESVVYLAALALSAWLVWRRSSFSLAASAAGVTAYVAVSLILVALPFGAHVDQILVRALATSFAPSDLGLLGRLSVVAEFFGGAEQPPPRASPAFIPLAATLGAVLLLGLGARRRLQSAAVVPLAVAVVGAIASIPVLATLDDRRTLLTGWLTACPLFAASLPLLAGPLSRVRGAPASDRGGRRAARDFVALTALLFLIAGVLLPLQTGGNQWGPRYLLPLFPLCVCIILAGLERDGRARFRRREGARAALVTLLVLVGVGAQAIGVRNHLAMRREKAEALETLARAPGDHLLTNAWFLPQEAALISLRSGKRMLLATRATDLRYAVERLARAGEDYFTWVEVEPEAAGRRRWGPYREAPLVEFHMQPFDLRASLFSREAP